MINTLIVLTLIGIMLLLIYFVEPIITKEKIKNNNEHGSARWSTFKEIKKNFSMEEIEKINKSGFPVYFSKDNKKVWFDNLTPHWICLGSTGSGKSVTSVIPTCSFIATAKIKKSVFITDPKGEIFDTTSKMFQDNGYKIYTLDFRNPQLSNRINLLEPAIKEYELYSENKQLAINELDSDKKMEYNNNSIVHFAECNQLVSDISSMIMKDSTAREKFWNNSSSDLLYGLIFLFLEDYIDGKIKRNQITLTSIKKFQNSSMTEDNNEYLKNYMEQKSYDMKSKDKLLPLLNTSETTYRSITSTFNERMTLYDDVNVENITSESDFEFDVLGKTPCVLYCCIPDESKIYYSLISIIVSLIYKTLVLLCNEQIDKRLPTELVFLLDEFSNTPPLKDISTMVSVARSRGISYVYYIQSLSQIDNLYGKEVSQTIQDNCGLAYLKTNTQETADAISRRLGNQTISSSSLNYSLSFTNNNGSKNTSLMGRSLMTADEIKQLHHKTIIFPTIGHPILRDAITYDKFSCYKSGNITRQVRSLKRLVDTYYTVEKLIFSNNNEENQNNEEVKEKLESRVKKVMKLFNNVDHEIEYIRENNDDYGAIYLSAPIANQDIISLTNLSNELDFVFYVVSSEDKVKKEGRKTKIEIRVKET